MKKKTTIALIAVFLMLGVGFAISAFAKACFCTLNAMPSFIKQTLFGI